MSMKEQIGKVTLDLELYPGQDFYSEGAGEDLLLKLVQENSVPDFNDVIAHNANWSVLYHLSDIRWNIVDYLPIKDTDKVLEVGSGCGAITGALAKKAGSVTCIELSKKRSTINAYRNQDCDNVEIKVGNFQDVEKTLPADYDYVMLIGVFEYGASYIQGEKPYDTFLKILLGHLKEGGKLVIAIENKYGLKYLAGCREDHLGTFYSGIDGYEKKDGVRTFSRGELQNFAKEAGCSSRFYYPYPDYKFPFTVFSDDRLPLIGELSGKAPNFDYDRIVSFDEGSVFDELIRDGKFREHSNSFLMVMEKGEPHTDANDCLPIYSRHSNERSPEYAIRTDIEMDASGKKYVCKRALSPRSSEHIKAMATAYEKLKNCYEGTIFTPNELIRSGCPKREEEAVFAYVDGDSLEDRISALYAKGDEDAADSLILKMAEGIDSLPGRCDFEMSDAFLQLFGGAFGCCISGSLEKEAAMQLLKPEPALAYSDLDLIYSNILMNDTWNVIDYEWIADFPVPISFLKFRGLFYLCHDSLNDREGKLLPKLCEMLHISKELIELYTKMEHSLQQKIAGKRLSLIGFHSIMGRDAVPLDTLMYRGKRSERLDRVKIYFNRGNGFSEEDTLTTLARMDESDKVTLTLDLDADVKEIRIDPTDDPCMIHILSVTEKNDLLANGFCLGDGVVYYKDPDPQIIVQNVTGGARFEICYEITQLPDGFARSIGDALSDASEKKGGLFKRRKGPYEKISL